MTHRRIVAAAATWACMSAQATTGELRCDPAPRWERFTSIAMTMRTSGPDAPPSPVSFAITMHDDGVHVVADGPFAKVPAHLEMVQLEGPQGPVALGSDPSAPLQLGQADMVFALPMMALKRQFDGPCGLHAGTRYPIDLSAGDQVVKGEFQREGDTIRFTLDEQRGTAEHVAYAGQVTYARERGALPADLPIRGWTIFRKIPLPENGEPSRFDTLAALRESLAARGAK